MQCLNYFVKIFEQSWLNLIKILISSDNRGESTVCYSVRIKIRSICGLVNVWVWSLLLV